MTPPPPHAHSYVLLDRRSVAPAAAPRLEACLAELGDQGWRRVLQIDGLEAWLGPRSRLKAVQVHRRHILIGEWRGANRSLASLIGESRSSVEIAQRAVDHGWGRYVLAWIDDAAASLCLLRDPSGALDCVWWKSAGLTVATGEPPPELDPLWPEEVGIDWGTLAAFVENVALISDRLALHGLSPVGAGELVLTGDRPAHLDIWSPADFCARNRSWNDDPKALESVVDQTTSALASTHPRLIAELSGGLDSAVASAALMAAGRAGDARFINYYGAWREGDERNYAVEAADALGVRLECVKKAAAPTTVDELMLLGSALRPALNGLDTAYDADMANRAAETGASAILSGQGGDAVFQYAADPDIIVDRLRRVGPRALSPAYLTRLAQWTGTPAWALARHAFRRPARGEPPGPSHRWLRANTLPPAKASQVRALVNAQLFWGDALRSRAADLLQPLLTQPVIEHCLAIPTDILALGARDRGLARLAFAHRLPALVIERRSKGDLTQHYGKVVHASLSQLRPFLLDGELARRGVVDRTAADLALEQTALMRHPASNRWLIVAALEAWARGWVARLERHRRRHIAIQPVEDAVIQVADIAGARKGMALPETRH